jgi:hemolysin activation/secretion protein
VNGRHPLRHRGAPAATLAALLLAAHTVPAADVPAPPRYNSSDAAKAAEASKPPVQQESQPTPIILQQDEQPMDVAHGQTIFIRDFRLEGADFLEPQALATVLEPYRNRQLTMGEINAAANRVTVFIRKQGYVVARAYVPKQEVHEGVLTISVIAGRYGKFVMKNRSLVRDSVLQGIFDAVKDSSPTVANDDLEWAMLTVNDLPGARMPVVNIERGQEPGTADFVVETPAENRIAAYVMGDNYGSPLTGKNRLSAGMDVNSPAGIGDKLFVNGLTSNAAGLQNGRAGYDFPLSSGGALRGEISVSTTTYVLGDIYSPLDATGQATAAEAMLLLTALRSRSDGIYLSLNFASRRMSDDVDATGTRIDKRARVGFFAVQWEHYGKAFGYDAHTDLSGGMTFGRLSFDDPAQRALNWAGANTDGDYSKANAGLNSVLAFDSRWSLGGSLRLQKSLGKNLDGSEQLSISGASAIKSYPDGVIGDNGYLLNAELKYSLFPGRAVEQSLSLFADYGAVSPQNGSYTTIGRVAISDVGLGYSLSHRYFFGQLQFVQTTGDQVETSAYNHEFKVLALVGARL